MESVGGINFFLSRLVQLDGLGCVDLRAVSVAGLELLSASIEKLNKALEMKDDRLNLEPVKYPVKTKNIKVGR